MKIEPPFSSIVMCPIRWAVGSSRQVTVSMVWPDYHDVSINEADPIYCNMYQEFLEGNPTLDFEEFCKNELAFINNAKFYSAWFHDKIQDEFSNVALSRVQQTSVAVSKH